MFRVKKNLALGLLLLAAVSFIALSTGGEFLHGRVHHHSDQSSREECFIHQLQAQVFTALAAIFVALLIQFQEYTAPARRITIREFYRIIPNPRAPPVSL